MCAHVCVIVAVIELKFKFIISRGKYEEGLDCEMCYWYAGVVWIRYYFISYSMSTWWIMDTMNHLSVAGIIENDIFVVIIT